ncbi:uncharacterized protein LOC106151800 [Lingula anatina]|uniref:Uncharacterized protein LOC106151800 n=1 Tax=Lingula anatina TaxID=7574 RepID=A0A1S3H6B6_LINAN|nr:uncharacterized protein LOC106151800 [Lingula anatina]|eukprot:XP_013380669.1 uncharacterized protein LOC106151800 [Lingula anatina]
MRSIAAAQGKKLSVKVSLENKDEIKEAVELLGNLAAPEKNEGQGLVDKMTVTYCPEEGKWYWTPDAIEGVWMEANIRTASRGMYVDIPLIEKLKKVLDWLQRRETFQSGQPQPCYLCYLRHRKGAEETAVTGSL